MTREIPKGEADRVDEAFNRVLAAEAEVRAQVDACRAAAAAIAAAAAAKARRIGDLADRRMRLAHKVADKGVERAVAELLSSVPAALGEDLEAGLQARLEWAVVTLTDEILGASPKAQP